MTQKLLAPSHHRVLRAIAGTTAFLCLGLFAFSSALASSERGGSGLFHVEQAYSMPVGRPLISFYGGYFARDGAPEDGHLFTLVPSATFGLGGGFEGAIALPLEGRTTDLDSLAYDRRIDLRKRDLVAKFRWTGPLGGTDSRFGVQALLGLPIGDSTRPGGDDSPSLNLDPGLSVLYSINLGRLRYPMRLHANVGYWWSRDDGAFYYRDFPDAMPILNEGGASNDVLMAGIGVEVGLRRFVGIVELETQQFTQARSQLDSSENLWKLTLGVRSAISATIGVTAGVAFDLSSDDSSTPLDPGDIYPDTAFRLGFTFGGVLSREDYEARRAEKRQERAAEELEDDAASDPSPQPSAITTFAGVKRCQRPKIADPPSDKNTDPPPAFRQRLGRRRSWVRAVRSGGRPAVDSSRLGSG